MRYRTMAHDPHTLGTLDARITAMRELISEQDRRYADNRTCDQDAVKLAKGAADEAKGKVSTATILAITGILLSALSLGVVVVKMLAT